MKTDAALAAELSAAGYAGVRQHYTVARMADRALEVYEDVAAGAARGTEAPPAAVARAGK